jgi:predicted esterase
VALRARPAPQPFFNGIAEQPPKPELHQIANDPKRAYWLISPFGANTSVRLLTKEGGLRFQLLTADNGAPGGVKTKAMAGAPPAPPGAKEAPGLLVVLTSDGNGADAANFWQDVAHKAFAEKYYIAVVVAPKWSLDQSMTWITRATLKQVKDAKFSDEILAVDVVKDVTTGRSINPDHIFLHGVGEGGPVVYSASLEENTPFKGFYILSSAFKTAQLPPLTRAKGRRYYIQNLQDDKAAPFWMASAANKLLGEQGATTRLDTHSGYIGSKQDQAMWDQFKAILAWLETGK